MQTVGMRQLKDHLAEYLRAVRHGDVVLVTVRGEPTARLVPVSVGRKTALPLEIETRMWELAAEGFLVWNGGGIRIPEPVSSIQGPTLLSDLIVEDRD